MPGTAAGPGAERLRRFQEIHEWAIGQILTLAEIGLPPEQFRPFKKKVFEILHGAMKEKTCAALREEFQEDAGR